MSAVIKNREGYDSLLAAILRQTIQDYVVTKRRIFKGRTVKEKYDADGRLKSCEEFFYHTQYDYGDIDLKSIKRLCDEMVESGGKIYIRENRERKVWN